MLVEGKVEFCEAFNHGIFPCYLQVHMKGVYSDILVKCQSSVRMIVLCGNIFTIFLLPQDLPYVQLKTFN